MPDLTDKQVNGIAWLLHELRPDWGVPSVKALLLKNRNVPSVGALMIAATTKAMEASCRTPGPIFQPGPHWPEASAAERFLPKPDPCEDHPEEAAHNCRCCWADIKIGQRPQTHIGKRYTPTEQPEAPAGAGASIIPKETQ